jgi:hypothetical protein
MMVKTFGHVQLQVTAIQWLAAIPKTPFNLGEFAIAVLRISASN